jgi:cell division protein ZapE
LAEDWGQGVTLADVYAARINAGELKSDVGQVAVLDRLELLAAQLNGNGRNGGLLAKWFGRAGEAPRSLYIHGEVGRGKTMLMDLFFAAVAIPARRRIHFHAFMQEVHQRRARTTSANVIQDIARDVAAGARLLCLDEMQVTDIADAMILGRLFEALLAAGVIIVTTSNLPPGGLYKDGLNRNLFLPAIALMQERFDIVSLDSDRDYRLGRLKGRDTFITPLGPAATAAQQRIWQDLTETDRGHPQDINVLGRTLHVPEAAHGCARFSFSQLCEAPLGPADYLALASAFQTLFVTGIPALKASQRNEAKRFVLLIDTLYDTRRRLVATSAKDADAIYPRGDHRFEFGRTVSRLREMQSASWWGQKIVET